MEALFSLRTIFKTHNNALKTIGYELDLDKIEEAIIALDDVPCCVSTGIMTEGGLWKKQ